MAANVMEILKQIQSDLAGQKENIRNLHVIIEGKLTKLDLVESIVIGLDNKLDKQVNIQPHVLATMERLEQQVKENNMVLFGNNAEVVEDRSAISYKYNDYDKIQSETIVNDLQDPGVAPIEEIKHYKLERKVTEDSAAIRQTYDEETTCSFYKQDAAHACPTNFYRDEITMLDDKLNRIIHMYQADMKELKEMVMGFVASNVTNEEAESAILNDETVHISSTYFSAEQINQLNCEFKKITETNQAETSEINKKIDCVTELIKDFIAINELMTRDTQHLFSKQETAQTSTNTEWKSIFETNQSEIREEVKKLIKDFVFNKTPIEAALTPFIQKRFEISSIDFSIDQITEINSELKRISESCLATNVVPFIEVRSDYGKQVVVQSLQQGLYFKKYKRYARGLTSDMFVVKIGTNGLKRSDVIDIMTRNPKFKTIEVVRELLRCHEKLSDIGTTSYNLNFIYHIR